MKRRGVLGTVVAAITAAVLPKATVAPVTEFVKGDVLAETFTAAPTLMTMTADQVERAYARNPHHPEIAQAYARLVRGGFLPFTPRYPWSDEGRAQADAAREAFEAQITLPLTTWVDRAQIGKPTERVVAETLQTMDYCEWERQVARTYAGLRPGEILLDVVPYRDLPRYGAFDVPLAVATEGVALPVIGPESAAFNRWHQLRGSFRRAMLTGRPFVTEASDLAGKVRDVEQFLATS